MWIVDIAEYPFISESRWRHKLAAHDAAVPRLQPEPLPGGVSIISSPPHPRSSVRDVCFIERAGAPHIAVGRSPPSCPSRRRRGRHSRLPGCPRRVFFVADERERGLRRTCRGSTGPSVRPNCLFPRSLPRSRRVGATHFPKEHSTLWPRLHTVPNSWESFLILSWKDLCNKHRWKFHTQFGLPAKLFRMLGVRVNNFSTYPV